MTTTEPATDPARIPSRDETPCAAAGCDQPLRRNPRGRPALYCSPACRSATYRARPPRQPVTVEIDHGSTSAKGRPLGRVWLVRLRRGNHAVTIATGLGRLSAGHLANQIADILDANPVAEGGTNQ